MSGTEKVRFCSHCELHVNNISALTRKQAMRLVRKSKGRICVRYVKNPVDNKPLFADRLYQITRRAGIAAGVLGASLSLSTLAYAQGEPVLKKREAPTEISAKKEKPDDKSETVFGSISGTITDSNDAVIVNVSISVTNKETNETRQTVTNENGFYEVKDLIAGIYTIRAEAPYGFKIHVIESVSLADGENMAQNIAMEIGGEVYLTGMVSVVQYLTTLHNAVSDDDAEEVRNQIMRGAVVNQKDENYANITPLFIAVENGSAEIAEILLNFGAKPNARDDNRRTPLMRLDEDASPQLVNLLIKHGARVNLVDREGNTALIFAAPAASAEVLRILINHSSNINARNAQGRTALMEAAEADNAENVRALLEAGANVSLKNKNGETAYDLTTDEEIERLLAEYGAAVETVSD